MEKLFKRLTDLMESQRLYVNHTLTRKQVADKLNTNESYIHRAIKQCTGLTFTAYLFELRLEHARHQLADAEDQNTVETIALEAGYRSRKTFHQHFRQRYGCTPTEYRQRAAGSEALHPDSHADSTNE